MAEFTAKSLKSVDIDVIPANYWSWRYVGENQNQNMERLSASADNTLKILWAQCQKEKFPSLKAFSSHYNNITSGLITDKQYNMFYWHTKLIPIAHLMKLFAGDRVTKGGNIVPVADFAILKSHYSFFVKTGRAPDISNRGRTKTRFDDTAENNRTKVKFDGGGAVDIPKNDIWLRFTEGIKAANKGSNQRVTIPQMVLAALQMFMESRPDVFRRQAQMEVAPESALRKRDNTRIVIEIPSDLRVRMNYTIQRYNSANMSAITQVQFIEMAIKSMLERIPTEYVDPDLARELREGRNENV